MKYAKHAERTPIIYSYNNTPYYGTKLNFMPELPEVETTMRGIKPHINKQQIIEAIIRTPCLRWPIPKNLKRILQGQTVQKISRRGKYLLISLDEGTCIIHLGMSGRLSILNEVRTPQKHDHIDIWFANGKCLRYTDPRRFGALLYTNENPQHHPLLRHIGPEPLSSRFSGDYLWQCSRGKKIPIKTFLMDSKIVAGIGNIYACEALFQARIHPQTPAGNIPATRYEKLVLAIQSVLQNAITKGGTTLKDFMKSDGSPGYFSLSLQVYGRGDEPCFVCQTRLQSIRLAQRSTVYCETCQDLIPSLAIC